MKIEQLSLESDEKILIQVRKHWFILAVQIFGLVGAALLPVVMYQLAKYFVPAVMGTMVNTALVIYAYTAWLILLWMRVFSIWTNYYLDVWTLTNKRLVAVDQRGLFSRTTASFRLERLQDIFISVNGLIATFLDFGTLELQTAGEDTNFKEYGMPSPGNLKALILSTSDNVLNRQEQNPKAPNTEV
jgi:uncharacterized membrane protein YdbT with pleckstrin-like domain